MFFYWQRFLLSPIGITKASKLIEERTHLNEKYPNITNIFVSRICLYKHLKIMFLHKRLISKWQVILFYAFGEVATAWAPLLQKYLLAFFKINCLFLEHFHFRICDTDRWWLLIRTQNLGVKVLIGKLKLHKFYDFALSKYKI